MLEHLVSPTPDTIELSPITPSIRSSDAKYSDDFMYLLRRRYGLVKAGDYSEALSLGTHWHALLEFEGRSDALELWNAYRARVLAEAPQRHADQVANDLDFAFGLWTDIIRGAPLSESGQSIAGFLAMPHIRSVASELTIVRGLPNGLSSTIQIDRLLHNTSTNQLVIADLKSTGTDAQVRAAQCPFEFQTWHYLENLHAALPTVCAHFDLPTDVTIASMLHLIFRKPTIRMSGEDRDYTLEHKTITRGPRKGTVDTIRNYHGQPRWHNFVERAKAWYRDNPGQILKSATHFSGNELLRMEYRTRLEKLCERALREPVPMLHPRTESGAVEWSGVSPYYPFYLSPDPDTWPMLAARHGFKVEHRDPPVEPLSENQVLIQEKS